MSTGKLPGLDASDVEGGRIHVKALLDAPGLSRELSNRLQTADEDNDGFISPNELVTILHEEQQVVQSRRMLRMIVIALSVLLVLNIAATAGLTYGIVYLTKDTNINNGSLVSKGTDSPVATGMAMNSFNLSTVYMADTEAITSAIGHITLPEGASGGVRVATVVDVLLVPNVSATITTAAGKVIFVNESGVFDYSQVDSIGNGRRLLAPFSPSPYIPATFTSPYSNTGKVGLPKTQPGMVTNGR